MNSECHLFGLKEISRLQDCVSPNLMTLRLLYYITYCITLLFTLHYFYCIILLYNITLHYFYCIILHYLYCIILLYNITLHYFDCIILLYNITLVLLYCTWACMELKAYKYRTVVSLLCMHEQRRNPGTKRTDFVHNRIAIDCTDTFLHQERVYSSFESHGVPSPCETDAQCSRTNG